MTDKEKLEAIRALHVISWVKCEWTEGSWCESHEKDEACDIEGGICHYCHGEYQSLDGMHDPQGPQLDKCWTLRILDGEV